MEVMPGGYTICRLPPGTIPKIAEKYIFYSLTMTCDETSLLLPESAILPDNVTKEPGWSGLKVAGKLDFSLVGILAKLSGILADEGISIFAVSTFDTDYLFVKTLRLADAIVALRKNGVSVSQ